MVLANVRDIVFLMKKNIISTLFLLLFMGVFWPINSYAQTTENRIESRGEYKAETRIELAQNKPTNIFELLFGPQKTKEVPSRKVQKTTRKPAPRASLPPPTPEVEKSPTATRLIVIGDSLAIDLAKALKRFYAKDPNLTIIGQGVGSSGFVRDDFFDWGNALKQAIKADSFDIAVVIMGINDKQNLMVNGASEKPLTDAWKKAYSDRLDSFLGQFRAANKPVVWVGLPPMASPRFSNSMIQISSLQQRAAFSGGAEFIDIYKRFADENDRYTSMGPSISGQNVLMRKSDGIHFSSAGSDKLAFYINQSVKHFYRGGTISLAISDPLLGTDSLHLERPPFQGLSQIRMLEVAGAVMPISNFKPRANEMINATNEEPMLQVLNLQKLVSAPVGRADSFGVGIDLNVELQKNN